MYHLADMYALLQTFRVLEKDFTKFKDVLQDEEDRHLASERQY